MLNMPRQRKSQANQPEKVLYVIVCAAPPAEHISELVELAQADAWDVYVIATPEATKFINSPQLSKLTGRPVKSAFRHPRIKKATPEPTAIAVVPATFNTINKWAAGIADTYAVSVLCEQLGHGTPIIAAPCLKDALALHPAFQESMERLQMYGIQMLHDPKNYPSPLIVPWVDIIHALNDRHSFRAMIPVNR